MGLYLTIFDGMAEVEGVEIGRYADFDYLRDLAVELLEQGDEGARFPTLMNHSDCDGEWTPEEAVVLGQELSELAEQFKRLPPRPFNSAWKENVAKEIGIHPRNLYECFFDVDGVPLFDRLLELARISQNRGLSILFQ
jgi:hypothetical protein